MPGRARAAVTLVPFTPAHATDAATLVTTRLRALRRRASPLPAAWTEPAVVAPLVTELSLRGSGLAAMHGDRLVGFQAATLIDGHGGRWAYTPDIGHAMADPRTLPRGLADRTLAALYAELAARWAREACLEHVVTVLANDSTALTTLARLGFGQLVVDLVRDLAPVSPSVGVDGVEIRRAWPGDVPAIVALDAALRTHLAASPIFLRMGAARPPEIQRRTLADPRVATFVAEEAGRTIGMLRIGPSANDVATIVRDPGTASITSAYTVADRRGDGVATQLLDAALRWARSEGYVRSAVDHESANGEASRFWTRHFTPVTVSLVRRLPANVAP